MLLVPTTLMGATLPVLVGGVGAFIGQRFELGHAALCVQSCGRDSRDAGGGVCVAAGVWRAYDDRGRGGDQC